MVPVNQAKIVYGRSPDRMSSATFFPDKSIPPKMGPMRGPPNAAFADIPATYTPGHMAFVLSMVIRSALSAHMDRSPISLPVSVKSFMSAFRSMTRKTSVA
jgi:hypothetical protein